MLRLKGQTESGEWEEFDIDDLNAVHARYDNDDSRLGLWVNKRKPNSLNGWTAIFVVSATIQPADDPRKQMLDEIRQLIERLSPRHGWYVMLDKLLPALDEMEAKL